MNVFCRSINLVPSFFILVQSTDEIWVILKVQPVNFYAIFPLISNISLNIHETKNKRNSKLEHSTRRTIVHFLNINLIPCFVL